MPSIVAVLVDDDRHVQLLPPEVGEKRREVLRLRHDVRGAHDRLQLDRGDPEVVDRAENRSRTWSTPTTSSRDSRKTGYRVNGESTTVARALSGDMSAEIAVTSGRGTITSATSFEAKSKTL